MEFVKQTDFIETYKKLESTVFDNVMNGKRSDNNKSSIMSYEDILSEFNRTDDSDKLKYLRTMRNLITHNPNITNFVAVTDNHIQYMNDMIHEIMSKKGTVKDIYLTPSKIGCLSFDTNVTSACDMFTLRKTDMLPVVDFEKNLVAYVTLSDIAKNIAKYGVKLTSKLKVLTGLKVLSKDDVLKKSLSLTTLACDIPNHDYPIPVLKGSKIVGFVK